LIADSDFEFGFSFIPTVAGQINAIVARIPDANPTLRVTIWDFDTETVLKTVTLNVAAANSTATLEITPLVLEKNKKYMITMNSNDYYERYKTDETDAIYPISAADINVTGYHWRDRFNSNISKLSSQTIITPVTQVLSSKKLNKNKV
jgi:hypothetical protein